MRKIFFTLFFPLWGIGGLFAQATVTPISADYDNSEVTFRVAWNAATAANNRVWVWVDFCSVAGTTPGTFAPATITSASVTSGAPADLNGRGFFVTVNGATVTAQLNATGKFNWCAYASDYPPNVLANTNSSYTLAGTPPFLLIASNGATSLTVPGTTIATAAVTFTPATITDATGYPGLWCPYTGSDLYMDDAHRCLQRQSGAQNWEAWIKDTRDNELYRIVKMPDNNWWLAQSVKYAGTGSSITVAGCTKETCGRWYTSTQANGGGSNSYGPNKQGVCPGAWTLPVAANWTALLNSIHTTAKTAAQYLACPQSNPTYSSWYGWSGSICVHRHDDPVTWDTYQSNDAVDYMVILWEDPANWVGANIGTIQPNCCPDSYRVRCFRQL